MPGEQKKIEQQDFDNPFERSAAVQEQTSNDGQHSTYERIPGRFPEDSDIIVQYRGVPKEKK